MSEALLRRLFPRDLHHVEGLRRVIRQHLSERGRLLDLGCGVNADLAPYRTAEREVWGTDFQAHPELQFPEWFRQLGQDGAIPFSAESFDAVVTVMVLEHVVEPDAFLREIARVLRPGGVFIGHSISGTHYVTAIRRIVGLLPHALNQALVKRLYGRAEVDTFPAYYRLNSPRRLARSSHQAGLAPIAFHRYADPGYFSFARPALALAVVADKVLEQFHAGWGRLYFTYVARKSRMEDEG